MSSNFPDLENIQARGFNQVDEVSAADVMKIVSVCKTGLADRDKTILLALVDTGCRASEFLEVDIVNLDVIYGEIQILQGKGGKYRMDFPGRNSRRKVRE